MARLYADEQYPLPVVEFLRALGHDVLTVQEAGKANQQIPDSDVLTFATSDNLPHSLFGSSQSEQLLPTSLRTEIGI
jgi:Domain of unknown function (DUF5615)